MASDLTQKPAPYTLQQLQLQLRLELAAAVNNVAAAVVPSHSMRQHGQLS
jgi:hypothetical protein